MKDVSDDREESDFEDRTRRAFEESVEALDASTLSRLNRARQTALAELAPRGRSRLTDWRPLGTVAAVALLAVAIWVGRMPGDPPATEAGTVAVAMAPDEAGDLEIVMEAEDLDMLAELEFYDWLESAEGFDGTNGSSNIG